MLDTDKDSTISQEEMSEHLAAPLTMFIFCLNVVYKQR